MLVTYDDIFILNVDKLDYCADIQNVKSFEPERYQLVISDINNTSCISSMLKRYNIDCIVHFAAQSHVDNSFGNSIQFTEDNILGTHCLLECARDYGKIKLFLHISTDEVYGEVDRNHPGCEEEKSLLNPSNPYAASKAAAEFLVRSYYHSFKLPIIITRSNNVYGERQYNEKLIPRFITNLIENKKCPIHGEGLSRRNFIYVEDVCKAVDTIMRKGKINGIYNIGSSDEYNVLEVLQHLLTLLDIDKTMNEVSEIVQDRLFNDSRYCVNSKKLEELGWKQETNFIQGLINTIEYYKSKKI
jgi:dTDP-glucose 4,6-dehydratase